MAKTPYTHRFQKTEVAKWKLQAKKENRNLTNFIETVVSNYVLNIDKKKK
jgi:hypothetical protein